MGTLEKEFERKNLQFQNLFMHDGDYVDEIKVKEVVEFFTKNITTKIEIIVGFC